jgi:hypothetical protein
LSETSRQFAALVADRHRAMTPEQRCKIASDLFEVARRIVDSSLPQSLSALDRRVAIARRLYGAELPDAAIAAHARHFMQPD